MSERWLLIDTCGTTGGVALFEANPFSGILAESLLLERTASANLLDAVGRLLSEVGWSVRDLDGVGVVSGPGSFTGVRVGLAAAKGLCEALGLPMAAVSRLEVLADASWPEVAKFAAMDAGRGEIFLRNAAGGESLLSLEDLPALVGREAVVTDDARLETKLAERGVVFRRVTLSAKDAVGLVLRKATDGGSDIALEDANYVRGEQQIYGKKS